MDGVVDLDPISPVFSWVPAACGGTELANLTFIGRVYPQESTVKQPRVSAGEFIRRALACSNATLAISGVALISVKYPQGVTLSRPRIL